MSTEPRLLPPDPSIQNSESLANSNRSKRGTHPVSLANLKAHAFKPGQTGNPKGRGLKPIGDRLTAKLIRKRYKAASNICDAIIAKAETGDVAAFCAVRDTVEGKPVQRVEGEQAITITIERVGD